MEPDAPLVASVPSFLRRLLLVIRVVAALATVPRPFRMPGVGPPLAYVVAPMVLPVLLAVIRVGLFRVVLRAVRFRTALLLFRVALEPVRRLQKAVVPPK